MCSAALGAVDAAIGRMPAVEDGALELCAPHGWRGVERVGAEAVRARVRPGLEHLVERIERADFGAVAPVVVGPVELTLPGARRARGELALRLAPGRGCAVCAAQLAAEEEAIGGPEVGVVCRPHLMTALRVQGALTPALSQGEREAWAAIVADLDEYIRKNDYRFRDEPRGEEQRSPWRAVAMVAGARDVR